MGELSVKGLAVSFGVITAVYLLCLGVASSFGYGIPIVEMIGSIYIGFQPGLLGGLIGALYGFIDGCIAGTILAWVYNKVSK